MARNRPHSQQNRVRREAIARASVAVQDFNEREREAERQAALICLHLAVAVRCAIAFNSTYPIEGFLNWYLISGAPVEISRYTSELFHGPTATALVMRRLGA